MAGVIIPKLPYREDDFSSFGVERDVPVSYTHLNICGWNGGFGTDLSATRRIAGIASSG